MQNGEYLDRLGNALEEYVVVMHHCLPRTGNPAGAIEIWVLRKLLGGPLDQIVQAIGRDNITLADVIEMPSRSFVTSSVQRSGSVTCADACR